MDIEKNLDQLGIYKRFEFMKPFIGENFETSSIKLLLIGESHYLKNNKGADIKSVWYEDSSKDLKALLTAEDKDYLNTRQIIGRDFLRNPTHKSFGIFKNTSQIVRDIHELSSIEEAINSLCFYNYFIRPAELTGKSIKVNEDDREKSFENFKSLLQILQPKKVVFVSSLAFREFKKSSLLENDKKLVDLMGSTIFKTCHPGSAWWNRRSKNYALNGSGTITGKERFIKILQS